MSAGLLHANVVMQIVTSAVCVFVAVHCSVAKYDGFQWPDASEIFFMIHVLYCHQQKPR